MSGMLGRLRDAVGGENDYWKFWRFGQSRGDSSDSKDSPSGRYREFIYINEGSVRDLLTSTGEGGIPKERTNRNSNTSGRRTSANLGAGTPPVKGSVGYQRTNQSREEQEDVFSFEDVESMFARLYQNEATNPIIKVDNDKSHTFEEDLSLNNLKRGDLIEVHGTIQTHELYRVYKMIEYIESVSSEDVTGEIEDVELIKETIGTKVPIELTVDEIAVEEENGNRLSTEDQNDKQVLSLVGLLDEDKLPSDPVESLSSDKDFTAFCRVESTSPQWYPMKLIRLLRSLSKPAAESFNRRLKATMSEVFDKFQSELFGYENSNDALAKENIKRLQREYSKHLNSYMKCGEITDEDIEKVIQGTNVTSPASGGTPEEHRRELLKNIHEKILDILSIDDSDLSEPATEIRSSFNMNLDTGSSFNEEEKMPHLEVGIVAIYW